VDVAVAGSDGVGPEEADWEVWVRGGAGVCGTDAGMNAAGSSRVAVDGD
jgi:hypothetical protein